MLQPYRGRPISLIKVGGRPLLPLPPGISGDNAHIRLCFTCFWTNVFSPIRNGRRIESLRPLQVRQ